MKMGLISAMYSSFMYGLHNIIIHDLYILHGHGSFSQYN